MSSGVIGSGKAPEVSVVRDWIKNAPEDEFRLVRRKSTPPTASVPLKPLTTMERLSVTDEPGVVILLLSGVTTRLTVPIVAKAIVGKAKATIKAAKNLLMPNFIRTVFPSTTLLLFLWGICKPFVRCGA